MQEGFSYHFPVNINTIKEKRQDKAQSVWNSPVLPEELSKTNQIFIEVIYKIISCTFGMRINEFQLKKKKLFFVLLKVFFAKT